MNTFILRYRCAETAHHNPPRLAGAPSKSDDHGFRIPLSGPAVAVPQPASFENIHERELALTPTLESILHPTPDASAAFFRNL